LPDRFQIGGWRRPIRSYLAGATRRATSRGEGGCALARWTYRPSFANCGTRGARCTARPRNSREERSRLPARARNGIRHGKADVHPFEGEAACRATQGSLAPMRQPIALRSDHSSCFDRLFSSAIAAFPRQPLRRRELEPFSRIREAARCINARASPGSHLRIDKLPQIVKEPSSDLTGPLRRVRFDVDAMCGPVHCEKGRFKFSRTAQRDSIGMEFAQHLANAEVARRQRAIVQRPVAQSPGRNRPRRPLLFVRASSGERLRGRRSKRCRTPPSSGKMRRRVSISKVAAARGRFLVASHAASCILSQRFFAGARFLGDILSEMPSIVAL